MADGAGIDSISLNPDTVVETWQQLAAAAAMSSPKEGLRHMDNYVWWLVIGLLAGREC